MFLKFKNLIIKIRSSLKTEGSFVQNFSFVASGKLLAAISAFVFVPILARVFPPEAYGNFAIFNSISMVSSIVLLMGYPSSYVLIKEDCEANTLISFQLISIALFSLFLGIVSTLVFFLFTKPFDHLYLLIPLGILTNGMMSILSSWNIRAKKFKLSSRLEGIGAPSMRLITLFIGWLTKGNLNGLIYGNIIGRFSINIINLYRFLIAEKQPIRRLSPKALKSIFLKFSRYPKYILPNQLLGYFAGQIPVFALAYLFDNKHLGFYSMSVTLFSLPIQMIINSISPVFLEKANRAYDRSEEELKIFTTKLIKVIQFTSLIPLVILIVFSEEIIVFALGESWLVTSKVIKIMAFYIFLELTIRPLSGIFLIYKKENTVLKLSITLNLFISILFIVSLVFPFDFLTVVFFICTARIIVLITEGIIICKYTKIDYFKNIGYIFVIMIISSVLLNFVKLKLMA